MKLRQLKKQLKQRELQARRRKPRRWPWLLLLVALLLAVFYPLYRQYQLTVPLRLFNEGMTLESRGELEAAQQRYQRLYHAYPESEQAVEALLRVGRIQQYDRRLEQQALLSYLQLEHDFPEHPLVLAAREEAAGIVKYALRDYSRAIGFYQRLLEHENGRRDQYLYEIADCYFRLDNYTQARIELETLLKQYPQSSLIAEVLYRKGGLLLLENRLDAARQDWLQLIAQFPESSYGMQARFNLATLLEEDDLLQDALDAYQQLQNFPRPDLLKEKIEHLKKRIASKQKAI
ncbi:MAG: tetratricopeptide repeat protein [Desulfuromonadales bacterium]|nr:tetratricopeptide repeat protein [Desulfuromonadales bacterium]